MHERRDTLYYMNVAMPYFVYVKFEFDKIKKVVSSKSLRWFDPKDADDFNAGDVYSVYWDGDERTKGRYYDAVILHMTGEVKFFIA